MRKFTLVRTTMSVTPGGTGTGTLTYQWQYSKNGSGWINLSTSSTLSNTVVNAKTSYRVKVTRSAGGTGCASSVSFYSNVLTITPTGLVVPTVSLSSSSSNLCNNNSATITATTTNTGSGTLLYTFYKNSVAVQSSSSNTYSSSTFVNGDVIKVVVKITNGSCISSSSASSSNLTLTVNSSPTISSQPSSTHVNYCSGATGTNLSVTASAGSGTISKYEWYSNTSASTTGGTLVATNNSTSTTNTYAPSTATAGNFILLRYSY